MGSFEDFLSYRNNTLGKKHGVSGFHVFNNDVAKKIFEAKPKTISELSKIPGFPPGGERIKKYGKEIIDWFNRSNLFQ